MDVFVSLEFLRSRVPADLLDDLALLLGFCFDCGGSLGCKDGEVVCGRCGRVWGVENVDGSVPFPEDEGGVDVRFEGHWQAWKQPSLPKRRRRSNFGQLSGEGPYACFG